MSHPATRDPLGSRSPGCCYHSWNPQYCTPCRICQRPVLSLQPCALRRPALYSYPSVREPEHRQEFHPDYHQAERVRQELRQEYRRQECYQEHHYERAYERPRRQRSFEAPSSRRRDVDVVADGRPASNPHYHTHPPPGSSAGYPLSKSASVVRLGSPGGSLGQRSPGARVPKPPGYDQPHRWIGEETKRALPLHVYKYYLAQTKEYYRQNIKVITARKVSERSTNARTED